MSDFGAEAQPEAAVFQAEQALLEEQSPAEAAEGVENPVDSVHYEEQDIAMEQNAHEANENAVAEEVRRRGPGHSEDVRWNI